MESIDREVIANNFKGDFNQQSSLVRRTYLNLLTRLNLKQFTFKSVKPALLGTVTLFLLNANAGEAIAQISRGEQGTQVKEIQRCLKRLGIYGGPVNGRFGPQTERAVTRFQRRVKLRQVGFVGPRTDAALKKRCNSRKSRPSRNTARRPDCSRLREGCDGSRVRTLQSNLRRLGVYSGPVTGRFRGLTKSAVVRYQQRKGINPIGVVGPQTRRAIRRDLTRTRRPSPPPRTREVFCDLNRIQSLSPGCNGPWVRKLQEDLQLIGYFQDQIDGSYGRLTQNAVMTFQQDQNLQMTGIADSQTLARITALVNSRNQNIPPTIPPTLPPTLPPGNTPPPIPPINGPSPIPGNNTLPPPIPSPVPGNPSNLPPVSVPGIGVSSLRLGSRGMQVTRLQQNLQQLGYYRSRLTGFFDRYTQNAVFRFQQDNRLNPTGAADINTLQRIRQVLTNRRGTGGVKDVDFLYEGMSGDQVKQVQLRLKELGFFRDSEATGYYGPITSTAVSNFQQLYNLQITGTVDEATWRKLGFRVPSNSKRYVVIVPVSRPNTIAEVRQYYRQAVVNRSERGDYVYVGEFNNVNDARKVSKYLRDRNLDARVEYL